MLLCVAPLLIVDSSVNAAVTAIASFDRMEAREDLISPGSFSGEALVQSLEEEERKRQVVDAVVPVAEAGAVLAAPKEEPLPVGSQAQVNNAQDGLLDSESFESNATRVYDSGRELVAFNLWLDGGKATDMKTLESFDGVGSVAIEHLRGDEGTDDYINADNYYVEVRDGEERIKPGYGSIFTEPLSLAASDSVSIEFRYLLINTSFGAAVPSDGEFRLEASKDGGETFETIAVPDELSSITSSTAHQWRKDQAAACGGDAACEAEVWEVELGDVPIDGRRAYWSSLQQVELPAEYLTPYTVLRFKTYFEDVLGESLRLHLDKVDIRYTGQAPKLARDVVGPDNDDLDPSRSLFFASGFDTNDADGWGIFEDGGRNAYISDHLAESGSGNVILRDRFREGVSNGPGLGFQKPTYSSILTEPTDFSTYADLQVEFSFIANGLGISSDEPVGDDVTNTYFQLSVSRNAGIDYEVVETWRAGEDYLGDQRYNVTKTIPGALLGTYGFSTATKVKIQAFGRSIDDKIHIDNLALYTVGSVPSRAGEPVPFDPASATTTVLSADSTQATYELVNSTWVDGYTPGGDGFEGEWPFFSCQYFAVEHTDATHPEFGEHIKQEFDAELGKDVFNFYLHQEDHTPFLDDDNRARATPGTDRCRDDGAFDDRQRVEIKTYSESPESVLGVPGETHLLSWKMRLEDDFTVTDKFSHLHQVKPVGGESAGMPLFTLTAVAAKEEIGTDGEPAETSPARLNLRFSPSSVSQVTADQTDLDPLKGRWVQIVAKLHTGLVGRYEIIIVDAHNPGGEPLLQFETYTWPTWKITDDGDFNRFKWGLYRSIVQGDKLDDEDSVKYADFVISELTGPDAAQVDLMSFLLHANEISGSGPTDLLAPSYEVTGTAGDDVIFLTQDPSGSVFAVVNDVETEIAAASAHLIKVSAGPGSDTVIADANVTQSRLVIYGGDGDDTIIGGSSDDAIFGEAGDDLLLGADGVDDINGGLGNDTVIGGFRGDVLASGVDGDDQTLVDDDDGLTSGSTFESVVMSYLDLPWGYRATYFESLFDHAERFSGPDDMLSLDTLGEEGEEALDFVGIEDVDERRPGEEAYSFSLPLQQFIDFEGAILNYEAELTSEALAAVNEILGQAHSHSPDMGRSLISYALWRLGGGSVAASSLVFEEFVLEGFALSGAQYIRYVGGGYFAFGDDIDVWNVDDALAVATSDATYTFMNVTIGGGSYSSATDFVCEEVGVDCTQAEADIWAFLEFARRLDQGDTADEARFLAGIEGLSEAYDKYEALDSIAAARYLGNHWDEFALGESFNREELEDSLGYASHGTGAPTIPIDEEESVLRGALAYTLHNVGLFNTLDSDDLNGEVTQRGIDDFISKFERDLAKAADFLEASSASSDADELKNQLIAVVMANHEMFETVVSGPDSFMSLEDFQYYSTTDSSFMVLYRDAAQFLVGNYSVWTRFDTGATTFSWYQRPDGDVSIDGLSGAAEFIDLGSSESIESLMMESLFIRGFRNELDADETVRRNLGNMLMVLDGRELLAADPDGVIASGWPEQLEQILEEASLEAIDEATAEWINDNIVGELDLWLPGEVPLKSVIEDSFVVEAVGLDSAGVDAYAQSLLEESGYVFSGAMALLYSDTKSMRFHPQFVDQHDALVSRVSVAMFGLLGTDGDGELSDHDQWVVMEAVYELLDEDQQAFLEESIEDDDAYEGRDGQIQLLIDLAAALRTAGRLGKSLSEAINSAAKIGWSSVLPGLPAPVRQNGSVWFQKGFFHLMSGALSAWAVISASGELDDATDDDIALFTFLVVGMVSDISLGGIRAYNIEQFAARVAPAAEARQSGRTFRRLQSQAIDDALTGQGPAGPRPLSFRLYGVGEAASGVAGIGLGVLTALDADEAREAGDDFAAAMLSIQSAVSFAGGVSAMVKAAFYLGMQSLSGTVAMANIIMGPLAVVGALAMVALLIYVAVVTQSVTDQKQEYRVEAEQVFRPDVVFGDERRYWTAQEQDVWYDGGFNRGDRWGFNSGSFELDEIFTVEHPARDVWWA